jgi:hypothetical protein
LRGMPPRIGSFDPGLREDKRARGNRENSRRGGSRQEPKYQSEEQERGTVSPLLGIESNGEWRRRPRRPTPHRARPCRSACSRDPVAAGTEQPTPTTGRRGRGEWRHGGAAAAAGGGRIRADAARGREWRGDGIAGGEKSGDFGRSLGDVRRGRGQVEVGEDGSEEEEEGRRGACVA